MNTDMGVIMMNKNNRKMFIYIYLYIFMYIFIYINIYQFAHLKIEESQKKTVNPTNKVPAKKLTILPSGLIIAL